MKEKDSSGNVSLERQVRRCPICGETGGSMVNYNIERGEFMMHPICAARHFQRALKQIAEFPHAPDAYIVAAEALKDA